MPAVKYFSQHDPASGQLTARTNLRLIKRPDQTVWLMGHVFVRPASDQKETLNSLMQSVIAFVSKTAYPLWPLDPLIITYFKHHPEQQPLWYHRPYSK